MPTPSPRLIKSQGRVAASASRSFRRGTKSSRSHTSDSRVIMRPSSARFTMSNTAMAKLIPRLISPRVRFAPLKLNVGRPRRK